MTGSSPFARNANCIVGTSDFRRFLALAIVCLSSASHAAIVQIVPQGSVTQGAELRDNWRFIGLAGDFVKLDDGEHSLRIQISTAPSSVPDADRWDFIVALELALRIEGQRLQLTSARLQRANPCLASPPKNFRPVIAWEPPKVEVRDDGVIVLQLAVPRFGAPIKLSSCLAQASMAACTNQKAIVNVTSEPPGAEIWIDGELEAFKTDAKLSVPFCKGRQSKNLLLRFPNAVNCERTIALAPEANVAVTCKLAAPAQP